MLWSFILFILISSQEIPGKPILQRRDRPQTDRNLIDTSCLWKKYYSFPDRAVGLKVAGWRSGKGINPEELGTYEQGDMLMPKDYSVLTNSATRWPKATLIYDIPAGVFTPTSLNNINLAFASFTQKTCIKFKKRTTETAYVTFKSDNTGCWSTVGRTGQQQIINLQQSGCTAMPGTIVHEIMHSLGFFHEHTRIDRDGYITINYQNIISSAYGNFVKNNNATTSTQNLPYDVGSIMHYGPYAFTSNGNRTIVPFIPAYYMGQRTDFSSTDILRVKRAYC